MDLLLTHGFFLDEDPKELQIMKPYAPLGILYLLSHLRARGFNAEVFDSTFSSRQELQRVLETEQPGVVGVYANLMTRRSVLEILKAAQACGWKTVVGGPEPGAYVEQYLASGADAVVIGEGEATLEELVPVLRRGDIERLKDICGIAFLGQDGRTLKTPPRAQIANIDEQPWPGREAISIERYLEAWRSRHGAGSVSIITARGCPYDCRWCSHAVFGKSHRRRNPVLVVDEIDWILNRYSPDMLWIADDVFTIHHGWLAAFAAEMHRRSIRIPFECISRADRVNAQIADLLAGLGCFRIWIGSESGSQRILDAMARGVTVEQVQSAIALSKARGIQAGMFLMWGYEGEGLADIEATVQHVRKTQPDVYLTTVSYPIRGTPYFEEVAERVTTTAPWAESSDREARIRGRHSRRFYGNADQLLRAEVEMEKLLRDATPKDPSQWAQLQQMAEAAREGLRSAFAEAEA